MFVGDSITQGFSVGPHVGGFRLPLWQMIRAVRNDIDVIGFLHTYFDVDPTYAAYTGSPPLYALQRWQHSGYSGKKIEDITTNYTSGNVAVSGQPDLVFVMIGTNNVAAGDSAATMETKYNTMLDQIHAVSPSARIVICAICPFVAGSTVGGNLAAWNGVRDTFVTWLADAVNGPLATRRYVEFLDPTTGLSGADILSDGVHPNASGFTKIARTYFERLDGLYSVRRGLTCPRPFRQRLLQSSLKLATASADFVQFSSDASKSPATGDFAVSFDFYPTSLPATLGVLFQYGVPYTSGIMIASNGAGIGVYLISGAPIIGAGTNSPLVLNRWHRICVIGNRSRGLVALYVNGCPVSVASGVAAWTVATSLNGFVGTAGGIDGALGYYGTLRFYKGSSVPQIETKACSDAVEAEYFDGTPLCAGGTSNVPFNEGTGVSAADVVSGGVAGALAAGVGITTGWQLQTYPWNPGF
jgi:lysophospholipase L1-like esterase